MFETNIVFRQVKTWPSYQKYNIMFYDCRYCSVSESRISFIAVIYRRGKFIEKLKNNLFYFVTISFIADNSSPVLFKQAILAYTTLLLRQQIQNIIKCDLLKTLEPKKIKNYRFW